MGWRGEDSELLNWTVVGHKVNRVSGLATGRFLLIKGNRSESIFMLILESVV